MNTIILSIMLIIVSAMSIYWATKCKKLNEELNDISLRLDTAEIKHRSEILNEQNRTLEAYRDCKLRLSRININKRESFRLKTFEELTEGIYDPEQVPALLDKRMEMYDKIFCNKQEE